MLSAARLPQVRAEVCISLQASPNHIRRTKSSIKKRIIVRRSVRSMFGEQTFAQLRTGFKKACCASHICLNHIVPPRTKRTNQSRSSAEGRDWTRMFRELTSVKVRRGGWKKGYGDAQWLLYLLLILSAADLRRCSWLWHVCICDWLHF